MRGRTLYGSVVQFRLERLPVTQEVTGSSPVGVATNALKRANIRHKQPSEKQISTYVVKSGKKNVQLTDFKVTGDQTNKRSEKQYKYEEKMCGWLT